MAERQIGNNLGIAVKAGAQANQQSGGSAAGTVADLAPATTDDVASMRTALNTANAAVYTADRLGSMTVNDLIFACRREGLLGAVGNAVL